MIKEFFNHPEPFHSHSGHVGMDSRGESIKLSIFKLATVLGDHVSNTDLHVLSSITDEEIDDIVKVPSDSAQKATEYVTSEFLKQMYYTKMDIDLMGFLKQIPDGFATEDYVNDRIRTQKEELEKYAASLIGDYVKPGDYNIFQNTVNSKLNTLTDKYASLDQRVTGLSSDVSSLKSDVSSLKTRVSVLEKNGTGGGGTDKPSDGGSDNPGGDNTGGGTEGGSDSHKKTTVTYIPTVTQTTKGSYEIGTLYVDGEESTIWGKDNATTVINGGDPVDPIKCATVQVYKATGSNANRPDKPGSFSTDDTHLRITEGPVGWYKTPQLAANELNKKDIKLWVSIITLYSDGTNSGWSLPLEYVNVNNLILQATNDALEYYKSQIEDANSEINKVIADAKSQLKILNDRVNQGDEGHPDTSWREPVNKLVAEVNEYGWKVNEDLSVTYAERLFNAVEGEIVTRAGFADGTGGIKNAIQTITANFIELNVYDYKNNDKIDATFINQTPTLIVLKALEGIGYDNGDLAKALNSAVVDIVKGKITLSVVDGGSGKGTQFKIGFDGNGSSEAVLDTSKFVVTGDMIVNAVNTNGISIQSKEEVGTIVASIDSDGEAIFGKGTTIFKKDGSGATACGNIKWDKNGSLQITGLMTDKSVTTSEEWDVVTNELVKKGDEKIEETDRYFLIVNPNRATSYFMPTVDDTGLLRTPEVVFLPMYISNDDTCKLLCSNADGSTRLKTYIVPKYQTAGTRIRISKGRALNDFYRWAYLADSEYQRLWQSGNSNNRSTVNAIYSQGTLLCADPRIFTQLSANFNISGKDYLPGTANLLQYAHGRFSINGVVARMLWLMPGQTVELESQIETINEQKCLVWNVINSGDFTIATVNVDLATTGASKTPIVFPGESGVLNPGLVGNPDNWSDAFIAHRKIDNSLLGGNINEVPRLRIVRNFDLIDDAPVTMARFFIPK